MNNEAYVQVLSDLEVADNFFQNAVGPTVDIAVHNLIAREIIFDNFLRCARDAKKELQQSQPVKTPKTLKQKLYSHFTLRRRIPQWLITMLNG